MWNQRLRKVGRSFDAASSSTGTRGILTSPASIASMSPKSLTTHGNRVPSGQPEPLRKNGVALRSWIGADADFVLDGFESAEPDACLFVALLRLRLLLAFERVEVVDGRFGFVLGRPAAVAVVRLVVEHDDLALRAQISEDSPHHLVGRLGEHARGVTLGEQHLLRGLWRAELLLRLEGVEVGDHDLRGSEVWQPVRGDEVHLPVVVRRVARQENAQPVADRDSGADDEERVAEAPILGVGDLVERVPRDQHRHDHGLPGARGHLVGDAVKAGVRLRRSRRATEFSIHTSPFFAAASAR